MYFRLVNLNHLQGLFSATLLEGLLSFGGPHIMGPSAPAQCMFIPLVMLTGSCSGGLCGPLFGLLLDPPATWHWFESYLFLPYLDPGSLEERPFILLASAFLVCLFSLVARATVCYPVFC